MIVEYLSLCSKPIAYPVMIKMLVQRGCTCAISDASVLEIVSFLRDVRLNAVSEASLVLRTRAKWWLNKHNRVKSLQFYVMARDTKSIVHLVNWYMYSLASSVISVSMEVSEDVGRSVFHPLVKADVEMADFHVSSSIVDLYCLMSEVEQALNLLQLEPVSSRGSDDILLNIALVLRGYWRGLQQLAYHEFEAQNDSVELPSSQAQSSLNLLSAAVTEFLGILYRVPSRFVPFVTACCWYSLMLCVDCSLTVHVMEVIVYLLNDYYHSSGLFNYSLQPLVSSAELNRCIAKVEL